jgi:hypothetical protein
MRATYPAHLIVLDFLILMLFYEVYKLLRHSICKGDGMVQSLQPTATGWTAGDRFPAEGIGFFFFAPVVQTHSASYSVGTGAYFPGVKRPGREADHSLPSTAEVKKGGAITPLPHAS